MKRFAAAVLLMGLSLPALATDLTVTYQLKEGKKNKGEKTVYWSEQYQLSSDKLSKIDILTDYTKGTIYTIDHGKKQVESINFKSMSGMMGGMSQMMGEMMNKPGLKKNETMGESLERSANKYLGDPDKAVLQKLGALTIAGRACDNYKVERKGGKFEMSEEVCVDPSLVPPQNPSADADQMAEAAQGMMGGVLGNMTSQGQKDLAGLKGTPLRRVNTSKMKGLFGGGTKGWDEEATSVKEGPIEAAVFQLPMGYRQIDQAKEMQEQMREMQKRMGEMGR
ncbi:MAG: hypothetical protein K8R69_02430 [Deltaproteobacteria bacterium]|nr:hypothetical protein [Deltaproteobacteria bacterium]